MKDWAGLLHRHRSAVLAGYVAAWIVAFVLTHLPGENLPELPSNDKVLHFVGFFGLALGLGAALSAFGVPGWRRVGTALLILGAYAFIDEATQPYFNRTFDLRDLACDAAGLVVGAVVWEGMLRRLLPGNRRSCGAAARYGS